jgi:hypothetical protein
MNFHEIAAALAVIIGSVGSVLYVSSVLKKQVRPHIFSWIIWGIIMVIAAAIQFKEGAGAGAWATVSGGIVCFIVAGLAVRFGEKNIVRSDWVALGLALCAIPIWLLTSNPVVAACWITFIDSMGIYPTFRKSWADPWREDLTVFFLWGVSTAFSVVAIESFSVATTLYPVYILIANSAITAMLFFRRRCVAKE